MTSPHLDHATLGPHRWAYVAGCWRQWSDVHADWLPSAPPPPEARRFSYRERVLSVPADQVISALAERQDSP